MSTLSQATGGRFFRNSNDLGRGMRELASAPDLIYALGFSPEKLKADGSFHKLQVKLTKLGDFTVQARPGYYAPTKTLQSGFEERFDAALIRAEGIAEIPAEVTTSLLKAPSGEPTLGVNVRIDVRNLPWQRGRNRSIERLRIVTALFDTQGKFLDGSETYVDLALKDSTLNWFLEHGLAQSLHLQAPTGTYQLRIVVQELVQGRVAALARTVEIH
jgi:hypothetical protein